MPKENPIQQKSYAFALKIVGLYKKLAFESREYVISKQILRSGTSIGANVEEAIGGQSRRDFGARMVIAYKEARETSYWLRILRDTKMIDLNIVNELLNDCEELKRILAKIQKTIYPKNFLENNEKNIVSNNL